MVRDVDLTSREWRELIFEGKNKAYGAYYLRKTSNKRHIRAIVIVAALMTFFILLPFALRFIDQILPQGDEAVTTVVNLDDLNIEKPDEKPDEPEIPLEPEQPLVNQVAYVAPVITNDAPPAEQNRQTQEELNQDDRVVSTQNVTGGVDTTVPPEDLGTALNVNQEPEKPVIHDYVPEMPSFPGGPSELNKFLYGSLRYPQADLEMGNKGTVVVQFTVSPTGKLTDFKVIRSVTPGLDNEALRVAKSMPNWTPGRQNGKAVYVSFKLPVQFKLQTQE